MTRQVERAGLLRSAMLEAVREGQADRPLLLSGGVDSATILAASLALGRRPACFTFHLAGADSPDTRAAQKLCDHFGLALSITILDRDLDKLVTDIRELVRLSGQTRKVHIQCAQPFLHVGRTIAEFGYREAWFGMAADDLWGTSRKGSVGFAEYGEEWFRSYRQFQVEDPQASDYTVMAATRRHGVELFDPWRAPAVIDVMLSCTMADMHKPKLKSLALRAFPEMWVQGAFYRQPGPLQITSGIREWHDTLLRTRYNTRGLKAVAAIYSDLGSGIV